MTIRLKDQKGTKPPNRQDPSPTNGLDVVTFGCRLNAYESEVIRDHASQAGVKDTVFINTCAVTAEATRQARQTIRRIKKERPDTKLVVTGCAAQTDPASFDSMPEVTTVMGNQDKMLPTAYAALATNRLARVSVNDIMSVTETAGHLIKGFGPRTRAFVQIQNGCNHRCTFCIIPYGRGNSRSVPMGEVVNQIKALVSEGFKEVVLTGVDITSYGEDLPLTPSLGVLCQKILTLVPDLPRLRISSIDSIEVDEPLMDAIVGDKRVMPHLHLSLQAGDNMVLKRMKRRHLREDAIAFTQQVLKQRPETVFGADIIAGFPTESEEMFQQSLSLIEDCALTWLHVFPYSAREGTPAARMPQIPKAVRKERAARLRAVGDQAVSKLFRKRVGGKAAVLIEKYDAEGFGIGHSEDFIPVRVKGASTPGDLVSVTLETDINDTKNAMVGLTT